MLFEDNVPYLVLKVLIVSLGTLGMMCTTMKFRRGGKKIRLLFLVSMAYVAASSYVIIRLFGYMLFLKVFFFTISVPGVILTGIISDEPAARLVFSRATQLLAALYLAVGATLLGSLLNWKEPWDILFRLASYAAAILLELRFLRHPFLWLANTVRDGWGILSLVPCALIVFGLTVALYPVHYTENPSGVVLLILLAVVTVIIYCAIFQYLRIQYAYQMQRRNSDILALQVQGIRDRVADMEQAAEAARIFRHDARHALSTIASLAESGDARAILDYVGEVLPQTVVKGPAQYCVDPVLNATLSSYLGRAEDLGIEVRTQFSLPESLPVDPAELSIVFANALENAITACLSLSREASDGLADQARIRECSQTCGHTGASWGGHPRVPAGDGRGGRPSGQAGGWIEVKCIHRPSLMLEISNSCRRDVAFGEDGLPQADGPEHGIGTRSIVAFCRKYDAYYAFAAEGGVFTLTVAL